MASPNMPNNRIVPRRLKAGSVQRSAAEKFFAKQRLARQVSVETDGLVETKSVATKLTNVSAATNDNDNDNDKPIKSLLKGKGLLPPVGLARLDS
jgi:hypothetical protein